MNIVEYAIPTLYPGGQARLIYTDEDVIEVHLPGREAYTKEAGHLLGLIDQESGGERIDLYGQGFDAGFLREFSRRVHQARDERNAPRVMSTFIMTRYTSSSEPCSATLLYRYPSTMITIITGMGEGARRTQKEIKLLRERLRNNQQNHVVLAKFPFPKKKIRQFLEMALPDS